MEIEKIYSEILDNLKLYNPVQPKVRLGTNADGGYVIVNGYKYDCLLSAGVDDEITFEVDFLTRNKTTPIFAFDGTVNRPSNLPSEIQFHKTNIGPNSGGNTTNLKEYSKKYDDIFIKMDIEGHEWNWINSFETHFSKVKQFVFEAHNIFPCEPPKGVTFYKRCGYKSHLDFLINVLKSLKIINKTHNLVHVHQNVCAEWAEFNGNEYPAFLELTFLRKDCDINGLNKDDLPVIGLDFPSGSKKIPEGVVDKPLNFYPFKF